MDVARITSQSLLHIAPLGASRGLTITPLAAPAIGPSRTTVDLTEEDRRAAFDGRASPAALAWERSFVDLRRRDGTRREGVTPVESFAEPKLRQAAATLGVRGRLNQDEVDRRFREIVKAERPDLGAMSGERLDEVRAARSALTAHLQRARWFAVDATPPPGTLADTVA
jgi:hypothetical protein